MANIFEILKNQQEKGFTLIDTDGNFFKGEKIKKEAYKVYNKGVQAGEIDPCFYDFKSYFDWFTGENFIEIESVIDNITSTLLEDDEPTFPDDMNITAEDTEQEG